MSELESVDIRSGTTGRFAFPFVPRVIRALIPPGSIGTYVLLADGRAVYVGRSDYCVQSRLANHDLMGRASHFAWEPKSTKFESYCLESYWYHRLVGAADCRNLIHPARPVDTDRGCPFCGEYVRAWRELFPATVVRSSTTESSVMQGVSNV